MRACETCGAEAPAGAAFCSQCGARLSAALPQQTVAALRRAERKVVTVLFADIKGSLELVAGQDPERAGEILGQVVACMTEAVRRHGGLVNQIMGDGIMALFGAPIAIEDHAVQACLAALEMRIAVKEQVTHPVHLRVGLGSGEVVVRAVSGDVALHYSAAGETVHMASRMEQAAGANEIFLTEATRTLASAVVEVAPRPDVLIKGIEGPTGVFELLGTLQGPAATKAGGRRLVGRGPEMDQLRRARDRARGGEGQAIRLIGEAGSGKSRLLRDFTTGHLGAEWRVCQAEAVPHRRTSHGLTADLLAALFGFSQGDDVVVRVGKVMAGLELRPADRAEALAPLSTLLGLQEHTPAWSALDAWDRRESEIDASVRAFQRVSLRQPVMVAVEDAHWLDAESATSIQRLGATAAGRQVLVVATQRGSADSSSLAGGDTWTECAVRALDEQATLAFLRSRLLPGHDVAALERKLVADTNGNPLFLEECLQALLETGDLVRVGDMVRLERDVSSLRVPSSLRGLLDARVDRLGDRERDVLQAAAVVGSVVPLDLLEGAAGLDGPDLKAALTSLEEGGFLIARPEGGVAFRHGLVREAAYETILKRTRARMHGAVLDALERRTGPASAIVDLHANHAHHAAAWPKAAVYARQAAAKAYDRYANPEAVQHYERAIEAATALPEGPVRDETLLGLRIGIRYPLFRLGRVAALGPHLDEAVRLAGGKPGYAERAQALIMRSHVHWLRGEPEGALADAAAVGVLAERHGDAELAVRGRFQRGLVGLSRGEIPETLADMGAVIADGLARRANGTSWVAGKYGLDERLLVNAYSYAARVHAAARQLGAARVACTAALSLAAEIGERQTQIYAHLADSVVSLAEGRATRALQAAAEADELCRGADIRLLSPVAAGCLARAHVAVGQPERALPIAHQAVEDASRMGFMAFYGVRLLIVGETLSALGRLDEAEAAARRTIEHARAFREAGVEAAGSVLLASTLAARGQGAAAAGLIGLARSIATGLGMEAWILEQHGAVHAR